MSRKKKSTPKVEDIVESIAVEEVVEETPEVVEEVVEVEIVEETPEVEVEVVEEVEVVAQPENKANYAHDAWWNEIGSRLFKRGYSQKAIVNKAKAAFGVEFDEARFNAYCNDNGITGNGSRGIPVRVEAVWKSQK